MKRQNNLAISENRNTTVVQMGIVSAKDKFNKFCSNYNNASWDNKIISVSTFLSLPISTCMLDPNLLLIKDTNGVMLGHRTLCDFITSPESNLGLGKKWDNWEDEVQAMIHKIEFGINSNSPQDVMLQLDDVQAKLGRIPVSRFEFNLAKDAILKEQVALMQDEHQSVVGEMSTRVHSLMGKLEGERKEKMLAIESLESTLVHLSSLQNELKEKESGVIDIENYVEIELYNKIVSELLELKSDHVAISNEYLNKIAKLKIASAEQISKIESLNKLMHLRDEEISLLRVKPSYDDSRIVHLDLEISSLKQEIVGLLNQNIHRQKIINKYKTISHHKSQINQLLRCKKMSATQPTMANKKLFVKKIKSKPFVAPKKDSIFKNSWVVFFISASSSISLIYAAYYVY